MKYPKRIKILFVILLFSSACVINKHIGFKYYYDKRHNYSTCKKSIIDDASCKIDSRFVTFKPNYYNTDSTIKNVGWFAYSNLSYTFIERGYVKKPEFANYRSISINDDFLTKSLFTVYDSINKKVTIYDSIFVRRSPIYMYETINYLYFDVNVSGSSRYWEVPPEDYISGIIIINKDIPEQPILYKYKNQRIIGLKEYNSNFVVNTELLKPESDVSMVLMNQISNHQWIGEYVSTGKYKEYIYNQNLELISDSICTFNPK